MSWVTSIGSLHGPKLSLILLLRRAMSSKRISSSMRRALSPGARLGSSARALTDPDAAPRLSAVTARRRVSAARGCAGTLVAAVLLLVVAPAAQAAAAVDLDADAAVARAEVRLVLAATNTGTAAARTLVPEVTWLDQRHRGEAVAVLPPRARSRSCSGSATPTPTAVPPPRSSCAPSARRTGGPCAPRSPRRRSRPWAR